MKLFHVIVIEIKRLEVAVMKETKEEATQSWRAGILMNEKIIEEEVIDINQVGKPIA